MLILQNCNEKLVEMTYQMLALWSKNFGYFAVTVKNNRDWNCLTWSLQFISLSAIKRKRCLVHRVMFVS